MRVSVPSAGQDYHYKTENMNVSVPSAGLSEPNTAFMTLVICRLLHNGNFILPHGKLLATHQRLCYDKFYPIHILRL